MSTAPPSRKRARTREDRQPPSVVIKAAHYIPTQITYNVNSTHDTKYCTHRCLNCKATCVTMFSMSLAHNVIKRVGNQLPEIAALETSSVCRPCRNKLTKPVKDALSATDWQDLNRKSLIMKEVPAPQACQERELVREALRTMGTIRRASKRMATLGLAKRGKSFVNAQLTMYNKDKKGNHVKEGGTIYFEQLEQSRSNSMYVKFDNQGDTATGRILNGDDGDSGTESPP